MGPWSHSQEMAELRFKSRIIYSACQAPGIMTSVRP